MFFAALCLAVVSMAQISEFSNFNGLLRKAEYIPNTYYILNNGVLNIYDNSVQCIKTISGVQQTISEDHGSQYTTDGYIFCLSKNIFTTSGKYEYLVAYRIYDASSDIEHTYLKLYNEDGTMLYDFGESALYGDLSHMLTFDNAWKFAPILIPNGNKLVIYRGPSEDPTGEDNSETYSTHVYNLPNNETVSNTSAEQVANMNKVYPNPANNIINIDYKISGKQMQRLDIMNISGKIVSTYLLDPYQNNLKVNVSSFEKGTYIYKYGNNSGKFIVE